VKNLIKDLYGRLVGRTPEDDMQSDDARLAHLKQTYAEHPSNGLTPAKLAMVLLEAERGNLQAQCELAEDIEEKDPHVFAELQKRRRALLSLPRRVVPPRNPSADEQRDTDMLNELLEDMTALPDLILGMGDAILKGFNNHELEWGLEDGLHIPQWHYREPAWFQVHPAERNELRLRDLTYEGQALRPFSWISHRHPAKSGYLDRSALVRILAWPYMFKNFSIRDWAEFNEIYGLPIRIGEYPSGASDKEKATLLKAVMGIGHNAGGIIPRGMTIDFKEAAKGTPETFRDLITWCEQSQSKAILGGTLTSQADGKSSTNALGNVHNEVRQELRDSDAELIQGTLTRDLIFPMYALNGRSYNGSRRTPRFIFDLTEAADIALYAQHLPNLVDLDLEVPKSWARNKLQIPEPEKDEPVLQRTPAPASTGADALTQQLVQGLAQLTQLSPIQADPVSQLVDQMSDHMAPAQDALIDQIRAVVESAENFEQVKAGLAALKIDHSDMAKRMGDALYIASLGGRHDLVKEAL